MVHPQKPPNSGTPPFFGLRSCRVCSDFFSSSASSAGRPMSPIFALANFVKYHPREIIVTVPQEKFIKPQR